ncbi:MAG: flagellar export chaperone FliS [Gemmatimonadota bacterium]
MSYAMTTARYVENDVLTRSPEWLVPLIYEHLLKNLRRAVVQIETKDLEGRSESLSNAALTVGELIASLDREQGGDFADGLASLYAYFAVELLNVGRSNGVGSLPQLIALVEELHAAWVEAAEIVAPRSKAPSLAATAA